MFGLIPMNPRVTIDVDDTGNPTRYCVDPETERILQNQRKAVAIIGSPFMIASAIYLQGPKWMRLSLAGMGFACMLSHISAYRAVKRAEARYNIGSKGN